MAASHSGSREQHTPQGRWRPRKRFWPARRGQNVVVRTGLMAVAVLLLGLGWGLNQYHQNVVINLGADLVGAIVTIFVIAPIVRRASEGRVREHPRLDYPWYVDRVAGATSAVRIIDTFSTRMGAIPYYMFVERDTGPKDYFAVPLARGYEIFRDAYKQVSGLARTVRGPIMSAAPGKVCVDGVVEICGVEPPASALGSRRHDARHLGTGRPACWWRMVAHRTLWPTRLTCN